MMILQKESNTKENKLSHKFLLVLPMNLWNDITKLAKKHRRSSTAEIITAIEEHLTDVPTGDELKRILLHRFMRYMIHKDDAIMGAYFSNLGLKENEKGEEMPEWAATEIEKFMFEIDIPGNWLDGIKFISDNS